VNRAAEEALSAIPDGEHIAMFADDLASTSAITRSNAVEALGTIQDARAVELLVIALSDAESFVQYYAEQSLRQIGTAEALDAIQQHQKRKME
jgi:HEAT repeat protein